MISFDKEDALNSSYIYLRFWSEGWRRHKRNANAKPGEVGM